MNRYEQSQLEIKNQKDYVKNLQRERRFDPAKGIYNPLYSSLDSIKVNPRPHSENIKKET